MLNLRNGRFGQTEWDWPQIVLTGAMALAVVALVAVIAITTQPAEKPASSKPPIGLEE